MLVPPLLLLVLPVLLLLLACWLVLAGARWLVCHAARLGSHPWRRSIQQRNLNSCGDRSGCTHTLNE